jgi:Fe-S-cluster containining protein
MKLSRSRQQLAHQKIVAAFEADTLEYKSDAACKKGCVFCCTDAGAIDITTLEGLIIRDRIERLPRPRKVALTKALVKDRSRREKGQITTCPFLLKNKTCMIYDIRPFSCRRIYSLNICDRNIPPTLNRNYMAKAEQTIAALQQLDDNGYSGHISYILHMLEAPKFLSIYLAGEFKPEEIAAFGKSHKIAIHRFIHTSEKQDSGLSDNSNIFESENQKN